MPLAHRAGRRRLVLDWDQAGPPCAVARTRRVRSVCSRRQSRALPEIASRLAQCAENQVPELDLDSSGGPQRPPESNNLLIGAPGWTGVGRVQNGRSGAAVSRRKHGLRLHGAKDVTGDLSGLGRVPVDHQVDALDERDGTRKFAGTGDEIRLAPGLSGSRSARRRATSSGSAVRQTTSSLSARTARMIICISPRFSTPAARKKRCFPARRWSVTTALSCLVASRRAPLARSWTFCACAERPTPEAARRAQRILRLCDGSRCCRS